MMDPHEDGGLENALPEYFLFPENRAAAVAWIEQRLFLQAMKQEPDWTSVMSQVNAHRWVADNLFFEEAEERLDNAIKRAVDDGRLEKARREAAARR